MDKSSQDKEASLTELQGLVGGLERSGLAACQKSKTEPEHLPVGEAPEAEGDIMEQARPGPIDIFWCPLPRRPCGQLLPCFDGRGRGGGFFFFLLFVFVWEGGRPILGQSGSIKFCAPQMRTKGWGLLFFGGWAHGVAWFFACFIALSCFFVGGVVGCGVGPPFLPFPLGKAFVRHFFVAVFLGSQEPQERPSERIGGGPTFCLLPCFTCKLSRGEEVIQHCCKGYTNSQPHSPEFFFVVV